MMCSCHVKFGMRMGARPAPNPIVRVGRPWTPDGAQLCPSSNECTRRRLQISTSDFGCTTNDDGRRSIVVVLDQESQCLDTWTMPIVGRRPTMLEPNFIVLSRRTRTHGRRPRTPAAMHPSSTIDRRPSSLVVHPKSDFEFQGGVLYIRWTLDRVGRRSSSRRSVDQL